MEPLDQNQFLIDFEALLRLTPHKNVVEFIGVCQSANWLYLLFEETNTSLKTLKRVLVGSRTTADAVDFTSLSELFVIQILCELSAAMEFLGNQKVCVNILYNFEFHSKIYNRIKEKNSFKLTVKI